jgi:hypothetical protein
MICLRTFDTRADLLAVLSAAGLASARGHDAARVDVFEVWPRVLVDGEWVDNTALPSKWTANVACAADIPAEYLTDPPVNPRRVFA